MPGGREETGVAGGQGGSCTEFQYGRIRKFWRRDNGEGCTTAGGQLRTLMGLGLGAGRRRGEEHDLRRAEEQVSAFREGKSPEPRK